MRNEGLKGGLRDHRNQHHQSQRPSTSSPPGGTTKKQLAEKLLSLGLHNWASGDGLGDCCWSAGTEIRKKSEIRSTGDGTTWNLLAPVRSLSLRLTAMTFQNLWLLLHFLTQIPLLGNSNLEPNRVEILANRFPLKQGGASHHRYHGTSYIFDSHQDP